MSGAGGHQPATDDDVVAAAITGDRSATARLLGRLQPAVIRYCRARLGTGYARNSADDVAQEVLLAVLNALPQYRDSTNSLPGFVFGIARNKIADVYRVRSRERCLPMKSLPDTTDGSPGPDDEVLRREMQSYLGRHLDALTDNQREALTLRLVIGLSVAETADAMGISTGAVRATQHRALNTLRRRLEGTGKNITK